MHAVLLALITAFASTPDLEASAPEPTSPHNADVPATAAAVLGLSYAAPFALAGFYTVSYFLLARPLCDLTSGLDSVIIYTDDRYSMPPRHDSVCLGPDPAYLWLFVPIAGPVLSARAFNDPQYGHHPDPTRERGLYMLSIAQTAAAVVGIVAAVMSTEEDSDHPSGASSTHLALTPLGGGGLFGISGSF